MSGHLNEVAAQALHRLREELDLEPLGESDDTAFYLDGQRSKGRYGRERLTLELVGDSVVEHHVAHLHEVMHKALNEDMSWGAALQLLDALEPWNGSAREFRDASRIVHESFATYMSVLLASSAFPEAPRVLDEYPRYRQLFTRVEGLLSGVAGIIGSTSFARRWLASACSRRSSRCSLRPSPVPLRSVFAPQWIGQTRGSPGYFSAVFLS